MTNRAQLCGGVERKTKNTLAAILLLVTTGAFAIDLEPIAVIGTPVGGLDGAWQGHVDFLAWLDADTLVFAGESGFVKCYSLRAHSEAWSAAVGDKIHNIAAGQGSLFLLDEHETIHILDAASGKRVRTISREAVAKSAGVPSLLPNNLAYVPQRNLLLVASYSENYGENTFLMDSRSFKVVGRIRSEGFLTKMSPSQDGSHIITLSNPDNIRLWSLDLRREVFNMGKNELGAIDAPFTSNAAFDGKRSLVYSVDNSWATGTLHVYDTQQKIELACFDSRNGHLEMDVDFRTLRVALTGTSRNLTLVDFSGRVLAERKKAADRRIVAVKFSPDRTRLALGSWDNSVRVFEIKDQGAKKAIDRDKK